MSVFNSIFDNWRIGFLAYLTKWYNLVDRRLSHPGDHFHASGIGDALVKLRLFP